MKDKKHSTVTNEFQTRFVFKYLIIFIIKAPHNSFISDSNALINLTLEHGGISGNSNFEFVGNNLKIELLDS